MNALPSRSAAALRVVCLALVAAALTLASGATARAQYCTPDECDECSLCDRCLRCCNDPPEFWVINTRCTNRCRNLDAGFERISYKRYDRECRRWVTESRESFLAQEASMPTMFFSHGNSLKHSGAMESAWELYHKLRCCPGTKRLVFWSWPAERVHKTQGLRIREMIEKNLRTKYVYAEYQGYYQAKLVQMMSLSQRTMMAGHSYGGIQAAVAAHLLGGGCIRGLTLEGGMAVERPNLRVGIISGAFDFDMMNPGHRYGQSFVAAEKVFNTRNIHDRTLRKWPRTSWRGCEAIGKVGINANRLGGYRHKLCQMTTHPEVGSSHYLGPHLQKNARFVNALCCLSYGCCSCSAGPPAYIEPEPEMAAALELPDAAASLDRRTLSWPGEAEAPPEGEEEEAEAEETVASQHPAQRWQSASRTQRQQSQKSSTRQASRWGRTRQHGRH